MYTNTEEVQRFLDGGGTLVVPTRQRAAAVRLAHAAAHLGAGDRVWPSPDVLPWSAWLQRDAPGAGAPGINRLRRLNSCEEWVLWRDSVREATAESTVLLPSTLLDSVCRASALLDDWDIVLVTAVHEESALLLNARRGFERRRKALSAVDPGHWRREPATSGRPVWFTGFDAFGAGVVRQLRARGARIDDEESGATSASAAVEVRACSDAEQELQQLALWCREQLLADPTARLLVVVPQLAQCEPQLRRRLAHALQAPELLSGIASDPWFAIEGGVPLMSYPLVRVAGSLLALTCQELPFGDFAALLRSSYLQYGPLESRLELELWLRQQNLVEVDLEHLQQVQPRIASLLGKSVGDALQRLVDSLAMPLGMLETPSWWARRFAAILARCGWPGEDALGSRELQVRMRYDELLGEFAACDDVAGRMDCRGALELLRGWMQRAALEPASDDVPVTVTAALTDPIVRYDAVWVMGMTADAWPRPATPDALVPLPAQRQAGYEPASADGRLRQAQRSMRAWEHSCQRLVYSWPQTRDDAQMEPSPLLPHAGARRSVGHVPLLELLRRSARLEPTADTSATAWPAARRLPGGARLFELQSECPFHACAQLRLHCEPLGSPQPGMDALARGNVLHRALERFWRDVGDSAALHQRSESATRRLVEECAARAVEEIADRLLQRPAARLLQVERERTVTLILALLDVERRRSHFLVEALEWTQTRVIGGAPVQLRLDRLDRLDDGSVAVIDYKTGAPRRFDPFAQRPDHAQLLAYSIAAGAKVAAVATAHLMPRGIVWRGMADIDGRLPLGITAQKLAVDWPSVLQDWRQRIETLAGEFCNGHAAVAPQARACEFCHLGLLCRIGAAVENDDEAAADVS